MTIHYLIAVANISDGGINVNDISYPNPSVNVISLNKGFVQKDTYPQNLTKSLTLLVEFILILFLTFVIYIIRHCNNMVCRC